MTEWKYNWLTIISHNRWAWNHLVGRRTRWAWARISAAMMTRTLHVRQFADVEAGEPPLPSWVPCRVEPCNGGRCTWQEPDVIVGYLDIPSADPDSARLN